MWLSASSMTQAFSLQFHFAADEPRALPWAGMTDAFGVYERGAGMSNAFGVQKRDAGMSNVVGVYKRGFCPETRFVG